MRLCLLLALASLTFSSLPGADEPWQVRTSGTTATLQAVVFGKGLFVAGSSDGAILTSSDGATWTTRSSGTSAPIRAIAFGAGRFVALVDDLQSPLRTSIDGLQWSVAPVTFHNGGYTQPGSGFDSIAYGNGRFVVGGAFADRAETLISTTGEQFTSVQGVDEGPDPTGYAGFYGWIRVTGFAHGKFFAGTYSGGASNVESADGVHWFPSSLFYSSGPVATDGNRRSVAPSSFNERINHSFDGGRTMRQTYTPPQRRPTTQNAFSTIFVAGCFVHGRIVMADASGSIWSSSDCEYWEWMANLDRAGEGFRAIAFDGIDRVVAVGSAPAGGEALIASARLGPEPRWSGPTYRITNLALLGDRSFVRANKITNNGLIGGSARRAPQIIDAAVLENGVVSSRVTDFSLGSSAIHGLNASSIGVGGYYGTTNSGVGAVVSGDRSARFPGGLMYYGGIPSNATGAVAADINSAGVVVGTYQGITGPGVFRHDPATGLTQDLGHLGLGDGATANAVSERGEFTGQHKFIGPSSYVYSAAYRRNADGSVVRFGSLGGLYGGGFAINSAGTVAGYSSYPYHDVSRRRAAIFVTDRAIDIDLFNSRDISSATAINERGDVVGYFRNDFEGSTRAFLHTNERFFDLNELLDVNSYGWVVNHASSINDLGQIVGSGTYQGQPNVPFLATPSTAERIPKVPRLINVSTRLRAGTGDSVAIAGFALRGPARRVLVRAMGPTLTSYFPPESAGLMLREPTLELFDQNGTSLQVAVNYGSQPFAARQEIAALVSGMNDREPAILTVLGEGTYTAVVRGVAATTGICLVEVYNADAKVSPELSNISTRGLVGTGDEVMIAGFVVSGIDPKRVLVRALGPSLTAFGVSDVLANPEVQVVDAQGRQVAFNGDWEATQRAEILQTNLAPGQPSEAASLLALEPGSYTAIVRGTGGLTGNAIVEVYVLD